MVELTHTVVPKTAWEAAQRKAASVDKLVEAVRFCRDIAAEELPHAPVGQGAEVVLRHIKRKCEEALRAAGVPDGPPG